MAVEEGGEVVGMEGGEVGKIAGRLVVGTVGLVEGEVSGVVRGERLNESLLSLTSLDSSSKAPARAKLVSRRPLKSNLGLADVTCNVAFQDAKDAPDLV